MVDFLTISPIFFLEKKEWYKTYCRVVLLNGNECMNEQRSELRIEKVHPPPLWILWVFWLEILKNLKMNSVAASTLDKCFICIWSNARN